MTDAAGPDEFADVVTGLTQAMVAYADENLPTTPPVAKTSTATDDPVASKLGLEEPATTTDDPVSQEPGLEEPASPAAEKDGDIDEAGDTLGPLSAYMSPGYPFAQPVRRFCSTSSVLASSQISRGPSLSSVDLGPPFPKEFDAVMQSIGDIRKTQEMHWERISNTAKSVDVAHEIKKLREELDKERTARKALQDRVNRVEDREYLQRTALEEERKARKALEERVDEMSRALDQEKKRKRDDTDESGGNRQLPSRNAKRGRLSR
ncbi:hypothetical protein AURDEDRAFT_160942 [Auricularia subglabra TFB-10046 SS5]|nr:hypothetical protein AURDEDRAFT_160942 [Auricularia subglabra TFB-10046 SS5]